MANYCYKCGRPVKKDNLFCGYCGAKIKEGNPGMSGFSLIKPSLPIVRDYDNRYDRSSIETVFRMVQKGDVAAVYELASRYGMGVDGVEKDPIKAVRLYKSVLKSQNHRGAFYNIGYLLSNGECGEEQMSECIPYFEAAVNLTSSDAASQLAVLYEFGEIVPQDLEKAVMYYEMAIQFGNGNGTEWTNKARVYEKIGNMALAQKSWEDALNHCNDCIQNGSDKDKVWYWTEKGNIYNYLDDALNAKECYEKALFFGKSAEAATGLGVIYEDGIPDKLDVDLQKAYYYYRLGYDTKDAEDTFSTFMLALFLFNGKAGEGQDLKAFNLFNELYKLGANDGNAYLGYYYGMGIPERVKADPAFALQLLDDVPLDDEAKALYYKGLIYFTKLNNEGKAREYLKLAIQKGDENAASLLETMNQNNQNAVGIVSKSKALMESDDLIEAYRIVVEGYTQYPNSLPIMRQLVEIDNILLLARASFGKLTSRDKKLCYHVLNLIRKLKENSYGTVGLHAIESNMHYCLGCIFHLENDIDNALLLLQLSNVDDTPDAAIEIFNIHLKYSNRFINEFYKDARLLKQSLNSKNWHKNSIKAVAYLALAMLYSDGAPGIKIDINYAYDCARKSYELDPNVGEGQLRKYRKNLAGDIIYTP